MPIGDPVLCQWSICGILLQKFNSTGSTRSLESLANGTSPVNKGRPDIIDFSGAAILYLERSNIPSNHLTPILAPRGMGHPTSEATLSIPSPTPFIRRPHLPKLSPVARRTPSALLLFLSDVISGSTPLFFCSWPRLVKRLDIRAILGLTKHIGSYFLRRP